MAAKEKAEYICPKEEFDRILRRFPLGNNFYLPLIIPYNVGTRIGETYAIDLLEDVDFKSHKLKINDQMMKIEKTWYLQPPKYESYRNVKMGKHLELEFKEAIKQRKINQLKYGSQYLKTYELPDKSIVQVRSDIVIPHKEIMLLGAKENGELLTPESFQYCARVVHKELGNPLFHSHCLRHTHGTILAERGINPRSVMERLGHKDIKTTLQTYTFNTDLMQQNAADVFEKYMYG
nr:site-specific integrase [Anaerosporobacter sp.]